MSKNSNNQNLMNNVSLFKGIDNRATLTHIEDIPRWLHDSLLFESLIENREKENHYISCRFIRENSDIRNLYEFIDIASVIDYWKLNFIPESMLYAVKNNIVSYPDFLIVKEMFPEIDWNLLEFFSRKTVQNKEEFNEAIKAVLYWGETLSD